MEKKVIGFLNEIRPEFNFLDSTNFITEGYLDSFDIVQLVDSLDKEFGISIDGLDILPENFSSIKNITDLIIKNGVAK